MYAYFANWVYMLYFPRLLALAETVKLTYTCITIFSEAAKQLVDNQFIVAKNKYSN